MSTLFCGTLKTFFEMQIHGEDDTAALARQTPRSEQRVFSLLQNDPQTEDWVVFHSLNLKQSGTQPYGEVDFVVLIPGAGVFCLEVKGGRVACKDGSVDDN